MKPKPWHAWVDEVQRAVASVPDDQLLAAARLMRRATVVVTAGNGGSSSLASHLAQALAKPDYAAGSARAAVCLTDNIATLTAHANDGGWGSALVECGIPHLVQPGAALACFSSSGRSENVCRLARFAREVGREVVAFTGFGGEPLRSIATLSIHVDSLDYEVVEPVHDALLHRVQYHLRAIADGSASLT